MNAVLFSLLALVSTSAGGMCALRLRDHLDPALGFTAGALLGIVLFDLLPEIFAASHSLGSSGRVAMVSVAVGFLVLHGTEAFLHTHAAQAACRARHPQHGAGLASALAMVAHSFVDGVGIGLAFQVSQPVGLSVAVAVIAHDFCDGLNAVNLMLMHGSVPIRARGMLALNAIAPVLGATATLAVAVPPGALVSSLAFAAGSLLYIGTSQILPRARAAADGRATLIWSGLMLLGGSCIYVATNVAI